MKKTTLEKWTTKAAATLEKRIDRAENKRGPIDQIRYYNDAEFGCLYVNDAGTVLYRIPGQHIPADASPSLAPMPGLADLFRRVRDDARLQLAAEVKQGTTGDGKAAVALYGEDGEPLAVIDAKLYKEAPAGSAAYVSGATLPVLFADEDGEPLVIVCPKRAADFTPAEEDAPKPVKKSRLVSIQPQTEPEAQPAQEVAEEPAEADSRNYYSVSFEYASGIYCANIARAESADDVKRYYSKYSWVSVKEASAAEVETARRKGMPFVDCPKADPAAEMPAEAPETAQEAAEAPQAEEVPAEAEKAEEKPAAASYTVNEEKDGLEISFTGKPSAEVREMLKASGFRWHNARRVWYAKQTPDRLTLAQSLTGDAVQGPEAQPQPQKEQTGKIDLAGIEGNKKTAYGSDFARILREDLKRRGASGFSIRSRRSGWTDAFTVTISLSSADFRSAEECAARDGWGTFFRTEETGCTVGGVEYSRWNQGREDATHKYITCGSNYTDTGAGSNFPVLRAFWADKIKRISGVYPRRMEKADLLPLTEEAAQRVRDIVAVIQSYNWDHSDPMTDYYDVGFYLDVDFKRPADFEPREYMTAEERAQLEKDLSAEAAAEAARLEEYRRQREAEAEEAKKAEERERADLAQIAEAVTVEDLPEEKQYFIRGLSAGIGKECSLDELRDGIRSTVDAKIARRVTFGSEEAFEVFGRRLMCEFDFVAGMGGTATDDARVTDSNVHQLTREQRETVKFYACECVAVYCGGLLRLVVNPEGYNYCRYCYLPGAETREETPEESAAATAAEEAETAALDPFFFPAPVADQLAALPVGELVTIYRADEWTLQNTAFCGILTAAEPGNYAQYSGVYLTIKRGAKANRIFCRNGLETVIFSGLPYSLPDSVKYASVKASGGTTISECRSQADEMRQIIKFYSAMGRKPIFDTVQR